jgi:hypothetical protein
LCLPKAGFFAHGEPARGPRLILRRRRHHDR